MSYFGTADYCSCLARGKRISLYRSLASTISITCLLLSTLLIGIGGAESDTPVFLEPVNNVTVVIGRDATLTCAVDNVGANQVAWVHIDRLMIVAIHQHMVTRIPRYTVSHDAHRKTWMLHIRGVQPEDAGGYACQVNDHPNVKQIGIVDVVVPPTIIDAESSPSHITVREGSRVTLTCRGDGVPAPRFMWRREDGRPINTGDKRRDSLQNIENDSLVLNKVTRTESGAYLCIASNGVPPSVSKRISLEVEFPPEIKVGAQMVGSPLGGDVTFQCVAEAQPKAITYWQRMGRAPSEDQVLLTSGRIMQDATSLGYKTDMKLTIKSVERTDIGSYRCVAKNALGEADGSVHLHETEMKTTPARPAPTYSVETFKKQTSSSKYSTQAPRPSSTPISSWNHSGYKSHQNQTSTRTSTQPITSSSGFSPRNELQLHCASIVIAAWILRWYRYN